MKSKAPFAASYIYILLALIGYAVADLSILSFRDQMIPSKAPPPARAKFRVNRNSDLASYNIITQKNIFNSDGKIPEALGSDPNAKGPADAPPVPSSLPLALVGTLVHADPSRSIATINIKNKNENQSFAVDDEIEGMVKIVHVERNKVIFRNLTLGRLEYIEIKSDSKLNFGVSTKPVATGEVVHDTDTDMSIKRTDVDRLTNNLSDILQQARAVPHFKNGAVDGFAIVDLQKGSIFEKLGLKPGDILHAANGEAIDSASKALKLYNDFKTATSIKLDVERDGRPETLNYTIQ